jgi:predicted Rossmann fold flavoprotein
VNLKTEEDGRMFPVTDSSETIIDCIWKQMMQNKVQVCFHKLVSALAPQGEQLLLQFNDGSEYLADKVLVTVGGFPKAEQYKWLEAAGHTIQSPVPSLFTFNIPKHPITELMGLSVPDATVKIAGTKIVTTGPLLITHWGMSGPAILKASAMGARELADRNYDFKAMINWLGDLQENELKEQLQELRREQGKQLVSGRNPFNLPKRLWEYLLQRCGIGEGVRWGEVPASAQNKLVEHLLRDTYEVKGKTTFKEEFVTCGGINLAEIDGQTLQSRKVPGLYFAGEILDVDGITGGYNFQHAWSSSWIAAQNITVG